ncbi:hypothetical protein GCM10027217_24120 [Pseudomaricurvus hydrocarbonicus]
MTLGHARHEKFITAINDLISIHRWLVCGSYRLNPIAFNQKVSNKGGRARSVKNSGVRY